MRFIYALFQRVFLFISNIFRFSGINNTDTQNPIKHVVFLILENRSFDQIFGYRNDFPIPYMVNGVKNCNSLEKSTRLFNLDKDGNKIYQNPMSAFTGHDDTVHDLGASLCCFNGIDNENPGSMSGFVIANQLKIKSSNNADNTIPVPVEEIMGYFQRDSFPVYEYIANNFTICDNWYASVPTCTLPNRAFALCASSDGHINNKCKGIDMKLLYKCDTIFDRLNDKNLPWKVYYNDFPISLVLEHQLKPENLQNYDKFKNFTVDIQNNNLPVFSFIEPEYGIESSSTKIDNVLNGQLLINDVIYSLQSNTEIWNSTLFVITYDENGGYFDHVNPPKAIPPRKPISSDLYTFDQLGCRVPTMLISPRIPIGVDSNVYDHTSILTFIEKNWNLEPLSDRDKENKNYFQLIEPRKDIPLISKYLDIKHISETSLRNRGSVDTEFFKTFAECNLIHLLADEDRGLNKMSKELHKCISKVVEKFT